MVRDQDQREPAEDTGLHGAGADGRVRGDQEPGGDQEKAPGGLQDTKEAATRTRQQRSANNQNTNKVISFNTFTILIFF